MQALWQGRSHTVQAVRPLLAAVVCETFLPSLVNLLKVQLEISRHKVRHLEATGEGME